MCRTLVGDLLGKSSRHATWSVCRCIVDKWDLLSFPIVPGLCWRAGDRTLIWWESSSKLAPCARCHSTWEISAGHYPNSPLSLFRSLDCLLDPSGIFVQSNLIDDHVSFLFPFYFWPPPCYRWNKPFVDRLSLPNYFFNLKTFFGLICGLNVWVGYNNIGS